MMRGWLFAALFVGCAGTTDDDAPADGDADTDSDSGDDWIDALGSSFDMVVSVLGTCDGGLRACNDDPQGTLVVPLLTGESIVVVVDGYGPDDYGDFVLNITQ